MTGVTYKYRTSQKWCVRVWQKWRSHFCHTRTHHFCEVLPPVAIRTKFCYYTLMTKSVYYQGGTLVLRDVDAYERPPAPFRLVRERWRCEGYHYGTIQPYLEEQDVRDTVPRWQPLNLKIQEAREAHDYQVAALAA